MKSTWKKIPGEKYLEEKYLEKKYLEMYPRKAPTKSTQNSQVADKYTEDNGIKTLRSGH